jgi:hypothetical protein
LRESPRPKNTRFFTEELRWLAGNDLEKIMGRGVAKWIGWDFKF